MTAINQLHNKWNRNACSLLRTDNRLVHKSRFIFLMFAANIYWIYRSTITHIHIIDEVMEIIIVGTVFVIRTHIYLLIWCVLCLLLCLMNIEKSIFFSAPRIRLIQWVCECFEFVKPNGNFQCRIKYTFGHIDSENLLPKINETSIWNEKGTHIINRISYKTHRFNEHE